jgi:predicted XRE-type DNA-binding protein
MSSPDITPADGNVFSDLNAPDAEYEKIRALLLASVLKWLETSGVTHQSAASSMGIKLSVLKDALDGQFQKFTIDQLVRMLVSVGVNLSISVTTDTP